MDELVFTILEIDGLAPDATGVVINRSGEWAKVHFYNPDMEVTLPVKTLRMAKVRSILNLPKGVIKSLEEIHSSATWDEYANDKTIPFKVLRDILIKNSLFTKET
jgi:hypothetical protein